ncbi:hypothetical protein D3C81_1547770 [compost metagenome]
MTGEGVIANVQLFHAQLTARDDDRAFAAQQSTVDAFVEHQGVLLSVVIEALMHLRVIDLDHRLVDDDGMRDPDGLGEQTDQPTADISLAGTRGAINHDRAPGVHRHTQLIEHLLREHYASQGIAHIVGVDATMVNGL